MKNIFFQKGDEIRFLNRSLSFILSCAIVLPLFSSGNDFKRYERTVSAASANLTYGDVNGDGIISILDLIILKSYMIENNTTGFIDQAADLDSDGKVSAKDVIELSMYLLNQIGSFSYEKNVDTDGDGLCDYVEKEILGTDYLKTDTDGDGLDDYAEVYLCNTDPLNTDTGNTGIIDSMKDADEDNLTNAEEIKLETSPKLADTDEDALSDFDEVNKYKTDPLNEDTDGDGISDNGEIKLGLNPLKKRSKGEAFDSEIVFEQKLNADSELLECFNDRRNIYRFSMSARSAGYIDESVSIEISAYSNYLNNDAIAGDIIDIDYIDDFKLESLTLYFEVPEKAENYFIFRYFEDVNMLLPIETQYNENIVFAECAEDGTYCIVHMDKWIEINAGTSEMYCSNEISNAVYATNSSVLKNTKDIEVFYLMYSLSKNFDRVKSYVKSSTLELIKYANRNNINIKLYYWGYNGILKNENFKYLDNYSTEENIDLLLSKLLPFSFSNQKSMADYPVLKQINLMKNGYINSDIPTYCYIINEDTMPPASYVKSVEKPWNSWDQVGYNEWIKMQDTDEKLRYYFDDSVIIAESNISDDVLKIAKDYDISFSVICNQDNKMLKRYKDSFLFNKKDVWYTTDDYSERIVSEVTGRDQNTVVAYELKTGLCNSIPYNPELIKREWKDAFAQYTSGKLKEDDLIKLGFPDTDGDGLCDCIEINMKYIDFDDSGNIILLTYDELVKSVLNDNFWGLGGLNNFTRLMSEKGVDLSEIRILPLLSNPTLEDSDFDGIEDKNDKNATRLNKIELEDKILDDANAFSPLPVSYNVNNYSQIKIDHSDNSVGYKYIYKNTIEMNDKNLQDYFIAPEDDSDYILEITSESNNDISYTVRRYEINRNGMRKSTSVVFDKRTAVDGKIKLSLKKDCKYEFLIEITTSDNSTNQVSTVFQQDNWIYAPNGGYITYGLSNAIRAWNDNDSFIITPKQIERLYIDSETMYSILKRSTVFFPVEFKGSTFDEWISGVADESLIDCCDISSDIFFKVIDYSSFSKIKDIFDISNGVVGNAASLSGVVLLFKPEAKVLSAVVTLIGGGTASFSSISDIVSREPEDDLPKALLKGNFNFYFERGNHLIGDEESFKPWKTNAYISKKAPLGYNVSSIVIFDSQKCFKYVDGKWTEDT